MAPLDATPALSVLRAVALEALDVLGRAEFERLVEQSTTIKEVDGFVKRTTDGGVVCGTRLGECFLPCNVDDAPAINAKLMLSLLPCAAGPFVAWAPRYQVNQEGWHVRVARPRAERSHGEATARPALVAQGPPRSEDRRRSAVPLASRACT